MESTQEEDRDSMISTFCSITGVETERGQFYLESADWNLQLAMQAFYEHSDEGFVSERQLPQVNSLNLQEMMARSEPDVVSNNPLMSNEESPPPTPKGSEKTRKSPKPSSRFATLDSLRSQQDSGGSSGEEEGQAFYAGGSTRSGQQVLGPSRKKNPDEVVSEMFKMAKEHGAQVVDPQEEAKLKKQFPAFKGTGFKLGSTSSDSQVVSSSPIRNERKQVEMTLKLWQNGFSIDDEPLRAYEDPANQEFLSSIRRGEIPSELVRSAHGGEVNLNMEDHRNEQFVQSKKPLQAFSGEGHRLGNPTEVPHMHSSTGDKSLEEEAQRALNVDETQPFTNVQIRLSDGSRLVVKMNVNRTVNDIRNYICTARPSYNGTPFILMTTFPNKELSDENVTIQDAKLLNACIVQRLK